MATSLAVSADSAIDARGAASAPEYSALRSSAERDSSLELLDEEAPLAAHEVPRESRELGPVAAAAAVRSAAQLPAHSPPRRSRKPARGGSSKLKKGRRGSDGYVRDKHGQLLIPDTQEAQGRGMAPTPDPEDEARRREGCRNAVLCWVAFACSYAGLGLLLLELHAEPDSFFAVRPWSEDFDARPTAYALFGFGGLLVLVMAARAIWRERHRTWLPCVALASCMRQTGTGYLLYGALSVALIFTLPYIVFLSVFRVQQVRKLPSDSPRPVG